MVAVHLFKFALRPGETAGQRVCCRGHSSGISAVFYPRVGCMMNDDDRINREVLTASIERGLNPPQRDTDVAEDDRLAPNAAVAVLDTMVAQYGWLSEWADRAQKAATAEVAVELARTNSAPEHVRIALAQAADEARMKLDASDLPDGVDARQVLESFAKIQRVAARKPDGCGN